MKDSATSYSGLCTVMYSVMYCGLCTVMYCVAVNVEIEKEGGGVRLGMGTVGQPVSQLGKTVWGNRARMHTGEKRWKVEN